jgi:hypothetical protein
MKNKIVLVIGIILLITTISTFNVYASYPKNEVLKIDSFFDVYIDIDDYSIGLEIIIKNNGDEIASGIDWTVNTSESGGIIVFGDGEHGRIPTSMNPNEERTVILMPIPRFFSKADGQSPIGFGNVNIIVSVKGTVGSTLRTGSATMKAFLLGPFVINMKEVQ